MMPSAQFDYAGASAGVVAVEPRAGFRDEVHAEAHWVCQTLCKSSTWRFLLQVIQMTSVEWLRSASNNDGNVTQP